MRLSPYAGAEDLAGMKGLLRALWRDEGPHVACLPGDLDWRLNRYPCDPEDHVVVCHDATGLVGFAWRFGVRSEVDLIVGAGATDATNLLIDWSERVEEGAPPAVIYALETQLSLRRALAARGYRPTPSAYLHFLQTAADPSPPPRWPAGYRGASMASLGVPVADRAGLHRAAFASARVSDVNYARVMSAPDYRADLDLVAVAADGRLAAFVLVWLEVALGVAVCEPVGTHPAHRGRGLAKALLAEARARAFALGADTLAVAAFGGDPVTPELYRAAGFRRVDRSVAYRRSEAGCADGSDPL